MIKISVVIPTYNRLERLNRVISALQKQTFPLEEIEILVVSDGSTDGTDDWLRSLQLPLALIPLIQSNQGVASARNLGLEHASGELVLFLDDDVFPADNLISEHYRSHQASSGSLVVIGPMVTPTDFHMSPWVRWEQDQLARQYREMSAGAWEATARQFYTGNTSLRREHLLASGGFDPQFKRAEDVELAYRLKDMGLRFIFNPKAIGYHYAERSFRSWIGIAYAYGQNDVIFTRQKEQPWLLHAILKEFSSRNLLTRGLTRLCLDRPVPRSISLWGMKQSMLAGDIIGSSRLTHFSCSGIFNLQHYQGIADELGGRETFFTALDMANRDEEIEYLYALTADRNL